MNVLITGINGSAAQYLVDFITENYPAVNVSGISRRIVPSDKYEVYQCDLSDLGATIRALKQLKPDYIFHLASNADVKMSYANPSAMLDNNINNTINLFEAIRILEIEPVVQMCSTSEVYGKPQYVPVCENHPINPANIYAISKLTQENIAKYYYEAFGCRVIITRAFGYINPKRHNIFSTAFAKQIAKIEQGKQDVLVHGNLESIRTLIDVRDIVRAYWIAVEKCDYGVPYNIGGTQPFSVKEILHKLCEKSTIEPNLHENPGLLRANDITEQIPSVDKFKEVTNFVPQFSIDESLDYLMGYCRLNV